MSVPARIALIDHAGLCVLFDALFAGPENTRLVHGGEEPVYRPADAQCSWHRIVFRHDYVSSALHEIAHWCIAGPQRRLHEDYGYWYSPDGRSPERQAEFESLEVKPQALEWIFSRACGLSFRPSIDNLNGAPADAAGFALAIQREVHRRCQEGLVGRAGRFHAELAARSGRRASLHEGDFGLDPAWLA